MPGHLVKTRSEHLTD